MADIYGFNKKSGERIVKAVKQWESQSQFVNRSNHLNQPAQEWFIAILVNEGPNGELDYTNNRYYFQRAKCVNADNDNTTSLEIEAITDVDNPLFKYDTAENLAEQLSQGHLVPCNTPVIIFVAKSAKSAESPRVNRVNRYWFYY